MKKAKGILAVYVAVLAFGQSTLAGQRFQGSLNFLMGYPLNDFKRNVDRTFYGFSGEFFYQFQRSPFAIGISLEFLNYGNETRLEWFSPDIPDVLVNVTTSNSIFSSAAVLRFSPIEGTFRPYVEVLAGFNYFFTYTGVSDDGDCSSDVATTTNFDDWNFTYGAGAGASIRVLDVRNRRGRSLVSLHLETGVRYLRGGTAEYLRKGSIRREDRGLRFEPLVSNTDLVKTHLGIVFRF